LETDRKIGGFGLGWWYSLTLTVTQGYEREVGRSEYGSSKSWFKDECK
jgi:hypothetical protein